MATKKTKKLSLKSLSDGVFSLKKLSTLPWSWMKSIPKPVEKFAKLANITHSLYVPGVALIYVIETPSKELIAEISKISKSTKGLDYIRAFLLQCAFEDETITISKALKNPSLEKVFMVMFDPEKELKPLTSWFGVINLFDSPIMKTLVPRITLNGITAETFRDVFGL